MLRSLYQSLLTGENRLNTYATLVVASVVLFFQLNTDPEVCGGDPIAPTRRGTPHLLASIAIPLPVQTASLGPIQQAFEQTVTTETPAKEAGSATTELVPVAEEHLSPDGQVLKGKVAIQVSRKYLLQGKERLERTPDYSAQFKRHERINGTLLDPQAMSLKVRHEPFSLYMKWTEGDRGRQLIFVKGLNDDHVLVQPGGVTGRLTGALQMPPDDPRVLAESRYPATCAGLLELTKIIIDHHETDLNREAGVVCEMRDGESFDERPCYATSLVYDNPTVNAEYHKSIILIDKELSLPVCVRNYTWVEGKPAAEDGEHNLIESYSYSGIEINPQYTDNDFEKSKYRMR